MARTTITLNVDATDLKDAEDRLAEMGISLQDVVDDLLSEIAEKGTIPFTRASEKKADPTKGKEDLLKELYGENATTDAGYDPGFFEHDEENPLA